MLGRDPLRPPETDEEPWTPPVSEPQTDYARSGRTLARIAAALSFIGLALLALIPFMVSRG